MDSSVDQWLMQQGTISDENQGLIVLDSSSPITQTSDLEDIFTCSRPLIDTRVIRPLHDQALKCPRCESTNTKFCYYNNYSLSQPRYFCKTCRRYWTKGGTLRNIPVGGGCRKNKKVSAKKSATTNNQERQLIGSSGVLSPPPLSAYHLHNINEENNGFPLTSFTDQTNFSTSLLHSHELFREVNEGVTDHNSGFFLENPTPIEFMGNNNNNNDNLGGIFSSFEMNPYLQCNSGTIIESYQRLMMQQQQPSDQNHEYMDVKPNNPTILSLEWRDNQQANCNSDNVGISGSYNYLGGMGSWIMNSYGSSNPLV